MPKKYIKKYQGEAFSTVTVPESNEAFYYTPKIVGVNFKSNLDPSRSRRNIISTFLELNERYIRLSSNDETRNRIIKMVGKEIIWNQRDHIQKHIKLVSEPDNKYDPNAIAVFVSVGAGPGYIDVGYIPKEHAKIIKEKYPKFFLIGAKGEGAGLRLDMILYKLGAGDKFADSIVEIPKQEIIQPTFLSLKKMRRSLEVKSAN